MRFKPGPWNKFGNELYCTLESYHLRIKPYRDGFQWTIDQQMNPSGVICFRGEQKTSRAAKKKVIKLYRSMRNK